MEVTGKLIKKLPLESGIGKKSGKPWEKLTFVLQKEGKYPSVLAIDTFKADTIQFISNTSVDTVLKCDINVDSREYNGRYFHNVGLWKAEVVGGQQQQAPQPAYAPPTEDLPF